MAQPPEKERQVNIREGMPLLAGRESRRKSATTDEKRIT